MIATASNGYTFSNWSGSTVCNGQGRTCTFTMPASSVTLTATFAPINPSAEVFPVNCQMPTGWTVPSGAHAGWAVATDYASEGTCSLKSASIVDSQKAQIQFTGTLATGNVTFSRKISSEHSFDCWRFYVDGIQQNDGGDCASGEVAWGCYAPR